MGSQQTFKNSSHCGTKGLYPGTEDISFKCLWLGDESLIHVSISCKTLASKVLLKGSTEVETTGHSIWTVGRMVHHLPAVEP